MSVNPIGNVSPPLGAITAAGDKAQGRSTTTRSADGPESLAVAPKGPKANSAPGIIRAHPTAPTEDMLQSLRDRELLAKRGPATPESKSRTTSAESQPESPGSSHRRTPYDPEPKRHSLDVLA